MQFACSEARRVSYAAAKASALLGHNRLGVGDFLSDDAGGALDSASYTTKLAGAYFHFDVDCTNSGAGFRTGQILGTAGSMFTGGTEAALAANAGGKATEIAFGHGTRHLVGTGLAKDGIA